jgi:hypothetical protein
MCSVLHSFSVNRGGSTLFSRMEQKFVLEKRRKKNFNRKNIWGNNILGKKIVMERKNSLKCAIVLWILDAFLRHLESLWCI